MRLHFLPLLIIIFLPSAFLFAHGPQPQNQAETNLQMARSELPVTGQVPTEYPMRHDYQMLARENSLPDLRQMATRPFHGIPMGAAGACITPRNIGSASNIFSVILGECNAVAASNALNTVLFIHRNNAGSFGGHSGNFRYDISTNGGVTWTNDQGAVNPASVNGSNAGRYPNVSIYNPTNNTNPSNAYLVYQGATVASTWNGIVTGVRRLNGTGNTENYNQAASSLTLIPRSQVNGAPGIFWSIDLVWNGTTTTGFRIMKGTFNTPSNTITWATQTTLTPTFIGTPQLSDFNIAFDPTGQIGWVGALTHISGAPANSALYPVFWKTTDGGNTWGNPTTVDIGSFPCISSRIVTGNVPSTAFDMDLTVDIYGNPHMVTTICNGNNAYAIFYGEWHAIFDITQENGMWNAIEMQRIFRGRGYFGNPTPGDSVDQDMHCQISRTEDGTKVFFLWVDSDTNVTTGTNNNAPDLFGQGYDVTTKMWTNVKDFTTCDPSFNNKALFPKAAPTVLSSGGNHKIPVVIAKLNANNSPLSAATFHYFDNADFSNGDFILPGCAAPLTVSTSGPTTICQGASVTLDAGAGHNAILWSTGSTSQSIVVSASGTYIVTVRDGCCLASDTVNITVNPLPSVGFSSVASLFTVNFTDTTGGSPSAWIWDFGDGNTSTMQNPTHTYASAGTYTVCLIATNACGSDTLCKTVGINCSPSTPSFTFTAGLLNYSFFGNSSATVVWSWDFGDGATSTFQNPLHTYASPGIYNVCLTTTDSCGSATTCQNITVTCPAPVSAFTWTNSANAVSFIDQSTGSVSGWTWDFGDGNLSTLANPTHTYSSPGIYTVCLITTNTCGNDTVCQTVDLLVGIEAGLNPVHIKLFPNPAREQATLQIETESVTGVELSLINTLGQTVRNFGNFPTSGSLQIQLPLQGLAQGMYYLRLFSEGHVTVYKLRIE